MLPLPIISLWIVLYSWLPAVSANLMMYSLFPIYDQVTKFIPGLLQLFPHSYEVKVSKHEQTTFVPFWYTLSLSCNVQLPVLLRYRRLAPAVAFRARRAAASAGAGAGGAGGVVPPQGTFWVFVP